MPIKNNLLFIFFLVLFPFIVSISSASGSAGDCPGAFNVDQINTIQGLAEAISKGLILTPKQITLWQIYQNTFFADPSNTSRGIKDVFEVLEQHPKLSKPAFRDIHVSFQSGESYQVPPQLSKYIKQFKQTNAKLRVPFISSHEHLPFWSKVLNIRAEDRKVQSQQTREKLVELFGEELLSKNTKEWSEADTIKLYHRLQREKEVQSKAGEDVSMLSKAILDLVHTSGFIHRNWLDQMEGTNPLVVLQALRKVLEYREHLSIKLGFKDFKELQGILELRNIDENFYSTKRLLEEVNHWEEKVRETNVVNSSVQQYRIRALSVIESPFRGCMGGDCSSRDYFHKGLDPNYIYWTKTDEGFKSSGQVTTILGVAKGANGQERKVAFIDKIQNIPIEELIPFLLAIKESLREEAYILSLPLEVGDHNGLSNTEALRDYVKSHILPHLVEKEILKGFTPHPHEYQFDHLYSRADDYSRANDGLELREFDIRPEGNYKMRADVKHSPYTLEGLTESGFVKAVYELRSRDVDAFINNIVGLTKLEVLSLSEGRETLMDLLREYRGHANSLGLKIRKKVLYELIGLGNLALSEFFKILNHFFTEQDRNVLVGEISNWKDTRKKERRDFFRVLGIAYSLDYPGMEIFSKIKVFKHKKKKRVSNQFANMLLSDVLGPSRYGIQDFLLIIERGDIDLAKFLIKKDPDVLSFRETMSVDRALNEAARKGHTEMVEFVRRGGL